MLCATDNPLYPEVLNPIKEALQAILGKKVKIPAYVVGHDFNHLTDVQYSEIQQLCIDNANPYWSTGIGIMGAACLIVEEAVGNANIYERKLSRRKVNYERA